MNIYKYTIAEILKVTKIDSVRFYSTNLIWANGVFFEDLLKITSIQQYLGFPTNDDKKDFLKLFVIKKTTVEKNKTWIT
jgi:hypothetical protein